MPEFEVIVASKSGNTEENISTDGYVLLFLEGDKIKVKGTIDNKALIPIITKLMADKLSKWR